MSVFYQDTACAMLQVAELPDDLQVMLNKADERIRAVPSVDGMYGSRGLCSRQAVAVIIAAWEATRTSTLHDALAKHARTYTGILSASQNARQKEVAYSVLPKDAQ